MLEKKDKNRYTHSSQNPLPSAIRFAALAVDAVCFRIHEGNLEVLMGKVTSPHNTFNGQWAHIGGLIQVHETAEEAVTRLLKDKAGITDTYIEQLYTFSNPKRDPRGRVVSVAYIALVNETTEQNALEANIETKWLPIAELPKLAYDHNEMTTIAHDRLMAKIMYTDIVRHLMPKEFTFSDLQKVYEIVLGEVMDKRNFRKRITSLNVLHDTKKTIKKGVMRPASLFSFK